MPRPSTAEEVCLLTPFFPDTPARLQIFEGCRSCHDVEGTCAVTIEPRLTDDLPPAAFADPGFLQFLKTDL